MTYFLSFHESLFVSCLDINSMRSINSQPKPVKRELAGTTLVVCLSVVSIRVCMCVSVCVRVRVRDFFSRGKGLKLKVTSQDRASLIQDASRQGEGVVKNFEFQGDIIYA